MQRILEKNLYKNDILEQAIREYYEYTGRKVNQKNQKDTIVLEGEEQDLIEVTDTYIYIYNEEN